MKLDCGKLNLHIMISRASTKKNQQEMHNNKINRGISSSDSVGIPQSTVFLSLTTTRLGINRKQTQEDSGMWKNEDWLEISRLHRWNNRSHMHTQEKPVIWNINSWVEPQRKSLLPRVKTLGKNGLAEEKSTLGTPILLSLNTAAIVSPWLHWEGGLPAPPGCSKWRSQKTSETSGTRTKVKCSCHWTPRKTS